MPPKEFWPKPDPPPVEGPRSFAVPNWNVPEFSRKNSRFSGKNRLNRDRFTCCSSASTWEKSVLRVKSHVRPDVTPYLTSTPTSPSYLLGKFAARFCEKLPKEYGLILILAPGSMPSNPSKAPARETR